MSLLNTFAILFETDAKKAKEDVEGLDGALGDLEEGAEGAAGGLDDVSQSADQGSVSIGGLTGTILKLGAAYVSLDFLASGVLENAMAIDVVGKFSQTLGENIVEIDAWGEAVARNGGSADAFRGSVESLNTSLADIKLTGGGDVVNTLAMLGVTATSAGGQIKSAFDVLPELADSFQRLSASESYAFGKKLGLDQGTILLLQQGRQAVDELVERQKLLGGVTEEGYEIAALFNDQWDDTKRIFGGVFMSANTMLLPVLTDILKLLEAGVMWVRENQDLVEGFFIGVAGVITAVYLPAVAAGAATTLLMLEPFILVGGAIAAVVAAIAILYEDLKAYTEGAPSFFGDMAKESELFKDILDSTIDVVNMLWQAFKDLSAFVVGAFSAPMDAIDTLNEKASSLLGWLWDKGLDIGGDLSLDSITENTQKVSHVVSGYNQNPLNNGGFVPSYQNSRTINVEVGGSTIDARGMTPQQAQQAFAGGLNDSVEMALGQLNDGVDR